MSDDARDELERRLARLRLPQKSATERLGEAENVVVEMKNVDEETVAKFLADAAKSTPPSALPATSDSFNRLLSKYESFPVENPIEVQFFTPSDAATRTDEEDAALIARLTDELHVERETGEGDLVEEFEKRLQGLKSFRPERGSSSTASAVGHEEGGGEGGEVELGPPPSFDRDEFERKARKRGGSSDDSDTSEEDKSSGEEEDSE